MRAGSAGSTLASCSGKLETNPRMQTIAVIPARLASTRLPRKMLRKIAGKPLVGWVYEAVRSSSLLSDVIIATDSAGDSGSLPQTGMESCR